MGTERFVQDGERKIAGLGSGFPHHEIVAADQNFRFKTEILHDCRRAHFAPVIAGARAMPSAFLRRLRRGRLGGVPSARSTTMMLVTNFLTPCRSKSMVVRSASDSMITPQPY